eukprot:gene4396-7771_t
MNTFNPIDFDFDFTPLSLEDELTCNLFDTFEQNKENNLIIPEKPASPQFQFFIKQAKTREEKFVGDIFPDSLLSSPYKYDLKIKGKISKNIKFKLVDAETFNEIELNQKSGITVETIEELSPREVVVRFIINFCSFHFKKKAFRIIIEMNNETIYTSTPFMTYARRKNDATSRVSPPRMTVSPQKKPTLSPTMIRNPKMSTSVPYDNRIKKQSLMKNTFINLNNDEMTAFALQLMQQLSPIERERVSVLSGLY